MRPLSDMAENMPMDFFIATHAERIRHRIFESHGEIVSMSRNIDSGDSAHPSFDGYSCVGTACSNLRRRESDILPIPR